MLSKHASPEPAFNINSTLLVLSGEGIVFTKQNNLFPPPSLNLFWGFLPTLQSIFGDGKGHVQDEESPVVRVVILACVRLFSLMLPRVK